jgi:HAMP domain-containing protein
MDDLLARIERLGNRVAASVLAAALIDAVIQLATWRRRQRP